MGTEPIPQITVRDAQVSDVPALTAIKGAGSEAIHTDRLGDAQHGDLRYLVLQVEQELVGFACLVFRRPEHWSDGKDTRHLPQIVDLQLKETQRGRGFGSHFIHAMEHMAAKAGYEQLYLHVEPLDNPRAYTLYQRLGYTQIQTEPYTSTWEFTDSTGKLHRGESLGVDMVMNVAAEGE